MSIGWIMFYKALTLALLAVVGESWIKYRKRREAGGLLLKKNKRTGVFEVSDWTETVERFFRGLWNFILWLGLAWWLVIAYYYLTGQKEDLRSIIIWVLTGQ